MKRTEAKQVGPSFSQLYVAPDNVGNVYPVEQLLYKRLGYQYRRGGSC